MNVPGSVMKQIESAAKEGRVRGYGIRPGVIPEGVTTVVTPSFEVWPQELPDGVSEGDFQKIVVRAAVSFGWLVAHCRKVLVKSGADKFHYETPMAPGWPDLTMAKAGLLVFAELKVGGNTRDGNQLVWGDLLSDVGGGVAYYCWHLRHWPFILRLLKGELE